MSTEIEPAIKWYEEMVKGTAETLSHSEGKRIAILTEIGRGEVARAIVLAAAHRMVYPADQIVMVAHYDGTMPKYDMLVGVGLMGMIAEFIMAPTPGGTRLSRAELLVPLRECFEVVYDAIPVPIGVYRRGAMTPKDVARLAPSATVYYGYPRDNWRLAYSQEPWWEIMAQTTGLKVSWRDLALAAPTICSPFPLQEELPPGADLQKLITASGSADETDAEFAPRPYVVIHNSGGCASHNKIAPPALMAAILEGLHNCGIESVQVGTITDQRIKGCSYKLGLRLPLTNRLIMDAVALIDVEGFLNYMAAGLNIRAAVFFGSTPPVLYGFPGNKNIIGTRCPADSKTCFWGGGWTWGDGWGTICAETPVPTSQGPRVVQRLNTILRNNPHYPYCANFPSPQQAAEIVVPWVQSLLFGGCVGQPGKA